MLRALFSRYSRRDASDEPHSGAVSRADWMQFIKVAVGSALPTLALFAPSVSTHCTHTS